MNKNAAQQYWEQQILNASPAERIVLLYDGAMRFLVQARKAIDDKDIKARYNANKRAGDIISYLQETLDMEQGGQVAANLSRIYSHILVRLMDVDIRNDQSAIDEVIGMLKPLRESWYKISTGQTEENMPDSEKSDEENSEKNHTPISAIV